MQRLLALATIGLALAGCGTLLATDPSASPASTLDPARPPTYAATPTPARSSQVRPTIQPNTADVEGRVLDATSRAPVASAMIRLLPFNLVLTSAVDGTFAARGLSVSGRCRWLTIEVEAPGHGKLVTMDNPLYQGRAQFDLFVRAEEQRIYFGPPLSQADQGEAFCSR